MNLPNFISVCRVTAIPVFVYLLFGRDNPAAGTATATLPGLTMLGQRFVRQRQLDLQTVIQWNVRMAGSLFTVLPVIVAFILLQRYYIRGLTAAAVK